MNTRSSTTARIAAASALALAVILAIIVVAGAVGGGSGGQQSAGAAHKTARKKRHVPAAYEVQSGDTLVSIAHKTGVPVRTIEALNPQVDPQILIAGETLKLR